MLCDIKFQTYNMTKPDKCIDPKKWARTAYDVSFFLGLLLNYVIA